MAHFDNVRPATSTAYLSATYAALAVEVLTAATTGPLEFDSTSTAVIMRPLNLRLASVTGELVPLILALTLVLLTLALTLLLSLAALLAATSVSTIPCH